MSRFGRILVTGATGELDLWFLAVSRLSHPVTLFENIGQVF
ncbi:MAG: hypothetical protein GAK28_00563 [Luteibacter sp.]|nr:hypothetical protein [Luteibacter sp.]KAF1008931.1 MAG: hypothetical protein GAK28_00563 [Luteibacter sp.]